MVVRLCWSMSCRASARRRWSIVRAEVWRDFACRKCDLGQVVPRSDVLGERGGHFRYPACAVAAMVDFADRDLRVRDAAGDGALPRCRGVPGLTQAADLVRAGRLLPAGIGRNPVVGRVVGGAALRGFPDRETARAARTVLSLRTLGAGTLGPLLLSCLLRAADGDDLDRRLRAGPNAEATGDLARDLCQKLYRSEPGVHTVCRGAGVSRDHAAARGADQAGASALRALTRFYCNDGLRHRLEDGVGHHAGDGGGIRAVASEIADQP